MKFSVSSTGLTNSLQAISRIVSTKSTLPILECILFDLKDGVLTLTASDGETTIRTVVETGESDGNILFAINSKKIIDSLKEISEQPITFIVNDTTKEIEIKYQNGQYKLIGFGGEDYPEPIAMGEETKTLTVDSETLLNGITRCLFAIAEDELRPVMNGVLFDVHSDNLTFVATDTHRLVCDKHYGSDNGESYSFILHKKPALTLKNLLHKQDGEVKITLNDRNAALEFSTFTMTCRLIDGKYPNYASVIPKDNPFNATIDRLSLISALRRVLVFASESNGLVKVRLDNNAVIVSTQDTEFATSAEESLMCDYSGNPMSIGFKGPFLIDVLNNIASQDVIMELADPGRAGIVKPAVQEEGEELIMLLMPMMLNE